MSEGEQPELRLRVEGLSKRFGATQALRRGEFECRPGEVVGLVGENGAGKSTLIKTLNGMVAPDSGSIEIDGWSVSISGPRRAAALGVGTVFQELSLIPELSVAQNLLLGKESKKLGFVNKKASLKRAVQILAEWECPEIDPGATVATLTLAQRQQVEIVRTLSKQPRVLLLDEPTSALTESEVEWLNRQVIRVRDAGGAVVLITHRIGEVKNLCSRIFVLRNGETVGVHDSRVPDEIIVEDMLGRQLSQELESSRAARAADGEVSLALRGVRLSSDSAPIDLTIREGEIVGVAGLEGQGQSDLFASIYGLTNTREGQIEVQGKRLRRGRVSDAIAAGLGLVPESRKEEGLFLDMSVMHNATIATLPKFSRAGWMRTRAERNAVRKHLETLHVATDRMNSPVVDLSGGNQQRVVFSKWLVRGSKVLLLFDPTRGVDVGAKVGIFDMLRDHTNAGGSVLFFSSELDELLAMSDRIIVMYGSSVRREVQSKEFDRTLILTAMLGKDEGDTV